MNHLEKIINPVHAAPHLSILLCKQSLRRLFHEVEESDPLILAYAYTHIFLVFLFNLSQLLMGLEH